MYELFWMMFNTHGVYLTHHENRGGTDYKWYNITEYEPSREENSRWLKSPLLSVIHLDERMLANHAVQHAFHSQLLQKWLYAKTRINLLPVFIKFTISLIYLVTFYVYQQDVPDPEELNSPVNVSIDSDDVNHTLSAGCGYGSMTNTHSTITMIYLMIHSAINLLHDIVGWVFYRFFEKHIYRQNYSIKGEKTLVLNQDVYYAATFAFHLFLLIGAPYIHERDNLFSYFVNLSLAGLSVPYILYMVQFVHRIGHFVVMMQAMSFIMLQFLIVFCCICLPWVFLFRSLILFDNEGKNQSYCYEM